MKLNENQKMYIRSMGKALKVTGIFTDVDKTNKFCNGTNNGVVAEFGKFIFTADMGDKGVCISSIDNDCLLSLVDGVTEVVELFEAKSPAQVAWKEQWLIKARKALKY